MKNGINYLSLNWWLPDFSNNISSFVMCSCWNHQFEHKNCTPKAQTFEYQSDHMGVSKNRGTPKSSILIGCSIIFTIHFGLFPPYFWFNTHIGYGKCFFDMDLKFPALALKRRPCPSGVPRTTGSQFRQYLPSPWHEQWVTMALPHRFFLVEVFVGIFAHM